MKKFSNKTNKKVFEMLELGILLEFENCKLN
jgi:hypothetical protein